MKLLTLLTTIRPEDIVEAHNRFYPDYPIGVDFYRNEFLPLIRAKILVQNTHERKMVIDHFIVRHDDPVDDQDTISVGVLREDHEEVCSMSFTPWGEALNYIVWDRTDCNFTPAEVAAHAYWEFTWHGMEDDMEERHSDLLDSVEEMERMLEAEVEVPQSEDGSPSVVVRSGGRFKTLEEALFPDSTPEERAERQIRTEKHIANFKTARTWMNGVEVKK